MANRRTGELALAANKYKWSKDRNCWLVHHSILVPCKDNPRDNLGDDKKALKSLIDSIRSSEFGQIHLPISVYIRELECHVMEGHRRLFASRHLIEDMKAANPEADTTPFEWLPVAIENPPDELSTAIRMHTSNALHKEWDFPHVLANSQRIFAAYKAKYPTARIETVPEDLAHALGWNIARYRTTVAIALSPTLMEAVSSYRSCTFKTWRHVVIVAGVLRDRYTIVMEELTGTKHSDEAEFIEGIYKLIVRKIRYYVGVTEETAQSKKAQPGAIIERCAKPLNRGDFPVDRVRAWLTSDVDLTVNSVERCTEASRRNKLTEEFIVAHRENPGAKAEDLRKVTTKVAELSITNSGRSRVQTRETRTTTITEDGNNHRAPMPAKAKEVTSIVVKVPNSKNGKVVFAEICKSIVGILKHPEVWNKLLPGDQAMADGVITILNSGSQPKKKVS